MTALWFNRHEMGSHHSGSLRRARRIARLLGVLGGLVLFVYGYLPTLQPQAVDFGRVYAAYGGLFVVLSLLWGWWMDGHRPDAASVCGAALCLAGAAIIMYWPRAVA